MKNKLLNIKKASEMLGVSMDTLRGWDNSGKFKSIRTLGNHRRYDREDIMNILNSNGAVRNNRRLLKDKIVVYTYICGDILHKGHLLYLKNAALLGDFLIVGVLTDEAVMEKKSMPIICFEERIELVSCLKMVDMAVPQSTYSPSSNLKEFRPDMLMESCSHDDDLIEEGRKVMKEVGGKVIVASYYPDQSSTNIKNKIREREQK